MGHGLDLKSKVYMPWEKRIEGIVLRRGHVPKLVDSPAYGKKQQREGIMQPSKKLLSQIK